MPIEIKELHIRIAVNTSPGGEPPESRSAYARGGKGSEDEKDAIVAECVEQVLSILQNKSER